MTSVDDQEVDDPQRMTAPQAVSILIDQHRQIVSLFEDVAQVPHAGRGAALARLSAFIAVHEATEQLAIHPLVSISGAGEEVSRSMDEEERVGSALASLAETDAGSEDFDSELEQLRATVAAHLSHEEDAEFASLNRTLGPDMAAIVAAGMELANRVVFDPAADLPLRIAAPFSQLREQAIELIADGPAAARIARVQRGSGLTPEPTP